MRAGPALLILSALFIVVAVLERVPALQLRPAPPWRPFMSTDVAWYLVASTAGLITAFLFGPPLSRLSIPGLADLVDGLPAWLRLLVAVTVYDLVAFAVHVGIHRSDALWSFHKVHHSSLNLDGLATTRTHMFELLVRNLPAQAALFALGMPASVVATSLLIYAAFALHGHSNLRVGGHWLELVLVTPRLHHLHHMPATTQSNFGTIFTLWDRILGRLVVRDANPHERTGVPGAIDEYPQRFLPAFRQPMMEVSRRHVPSPRGSGPADRLPAIGSKAA